MGGMKSLFTKIIPIVMLVCFICLGITHTFETAHINDLTYMSQETINIGSEDNVENFTYYEIDVNGYLNGLNNDFMSRSIKKVVNLDAYNQTLDNFTNIWANGYDLGDALRTTANAIFLVINTIILPINILLVPLRIICGIILTGISAVGVKTNTGGIITTSLNAIIDHAAIPFLTITFNKDRARILNTIWKFNTYPYVSASIMNRQDDKIFDVTYTLPGDSTTYNGIRLHSDNTSFSMWYRYIENNQQQEVKVYEGLYPQNHGTWTEQNRYHYITITDENLQNDFNDFYHYLDISAEQVYELPSTQYTNKTFTWQQNAIDSYASNQSITNMIVLDCELTSNNTNWVGLIIAGSNTEKMIGYWADRQSSATKVYDVNENGWTNNAYKTFTITSRYQDDSAIIQINNLISAGLIVEST